MKRALMAIVIAAIIGGGVYGLAASLNVSSATLGAGSAAVAACQSGTVNVTYAAAYSSSVPGYQATTVTLNGLDTTTAGTNCASKPFKVTLTDGSNLSLGEQTGTTPATGTTASVTFSGVSSAAVNGVHVVITG